MPRDKIVLNKKEAFDFFGFFKDIDHECYEEGCTFGEVVDHYGHKEKSVRFFCGGFFFPYYRSSCY